MKQERKEFVFKARIDRTTQFGLAVLAKLAGKSQSALIRDLVAKELSALPSKSTIERSRS